MPSVKDQVDEIFDALKERDQWEKELARSEAQRLCMDRAKVNNNPWPRASNVRYPLSDTIIAQFTPFLFKIFYSSERVAFFRALVAQNATAQGLMADWFDFKIKNDTDLEEVIQPCIDKILQDGETVMKVLWNEKKECFYFHHVDNLFFITPSTTLKLEDAPWCVHVLQKSKKWVLKHFAKVPGIEGFVDRIKGENTSPANDSGQRQENEYNREGISVSPKNQMIVLWEKHYKAEDGSYRIVTLSPDDPQFDFKDDRAYEYDLGGYMFEHTRWEKRDLKMHSARGIPRIVMEGEFTLTALERAKQNAMTLYNTPMMWAQNQVPGNTQNITWQPGHFLPFPVQVASMGEPPISWDIEGDRQRSKWERRVGSPDYGIGKANTMNDSRTATEVKAIEFQQSQAVDLITGNWRMFLGKVLKKAWKYVVEANKQKPLQSLQFFLGGKSQVIPPEMLNDEWQISITGSAESVNRETMTQKAITLWQMSQNNIYANLGEAWKNVLQNLIPGEVDRFYQDPAERQQLQVKKSQSDIGTMIATGAFMPPDPNDDLVTAGVTAAQYLVKEQQRLSDPQLAQQMQGTPQAGPQAVNLITQYIEACRQMLKQTNKQGFAQLMQVLNQIEMQAQQAAQQQAQMAAMQQQQVGNQAISNEILPMPKQEPELTRTRKTFTILRDESGRIASVVANGVESPVSGQINLGTSRNGQIAGAELNGVV